MAPAQSILDLPVEVRNQIYSYLFHHNEPITLQHPYWNGLSIFKADPVFYTSLFRTCKAISNDSIAYAYGKGCFKVRGPSLAFCNLGSKALGFIKDLTICHARWEEETPAETKVWQVMRNHCTGLGRLELELHADLILMSFRYIDLFYAALPPQQHRPCIMLDLYVWQPHYTFGERSGEAFKRSLAQLSGTHEASQSTPRFMDPVSRILSLPASPKLIVMVADVTHASIQAIDVFLKSTDAHRMSKKDLPLPTSGSRAQGRLERYSYTYGDGQQPK